MRGKAQQESERGWRAVALGLVAGAQLLCRGQATSVTVPAAADTFLWSLAPGNNYGAAGALSVSGSAAVNGSGQQNGLYISLLRFPMSNVVASADGTFGTNGWVLTEATLAVTEVGAPINGMFNRGVGGFEIRWIGADGWAEGTGTPMMTTADGIVYQDLGSVLNPASDVSLGLYTNGGVDGPISFNLPLAGSLVSGVRAGRPVSLYVTAASTTVGFTFNSRNFPTPSA